MNPLEQENRSLKRTLHLLISKAERNRDILRTFQEIELRLLSCDSLPDLLDMLLVTMREYFRLDAISLMLFDPEDTVQELIPHYGPPANSQLRFCNNYGDLKQLYRKQPSPWLGAPDQKIKKQCFPAAKRIGSCALLPLVRQDVIIGSLHLGSNDISRYTPNVATDYISHLASVISVCVENCISQETLRRLSIIDMLTKVHNRRAFDQELRREISRANRTEQPLSCLFIDLDHFKQINDTYGHQTGDLVLRQSAQAIAAKLRSTDLVARYGGEEFAVLLPGCDGKRAVDVAETIRAHLCELDFESVEGQPLKVTLSIGVTTCKPQSHTPGIIESAAKVLVACADKGVYQAKHNGRNRVEFVAQATDTKVLMPTHAAEA